MTILPNNRSTFHVWGLEYDFNVHCSSFSKWCIAVFIWLGRALKSSWYFMTFWGQKGAMKKAQDVSMKFSKSIVSVLCPFPKLLPAPFGMSGRFRAVRWIRHSDMTCNVSKKKGDLRGTGRWTRTWQSSQALPQKDLHSNIKQFMLSQEIPTPKPPHILPRYSCIYPPIQKRCIVGSSGCI